MQEQKMKSKLVNTVHDSLVTDIYPGELTAVMALQKEIMENVPQYAKKFMPSVNFRWLKVPLKADFEIGTHYGTYGMKDDPLECDKCFSNSIERTYVDNGELIGVCPNCGPCVCPLDSPVAKYRYNVAHGIL